MAQPPAPRGKIKNIRRVYGLILPYVRIYWKWFLLAYLSLLATVGLNLLKPWPLKLVIDNVLLSKPLPAGIGFLDTLTGRDKLLLLAFLCGGVVLIFFFEGLFAFARKYFMSSAGESTASAIRQQVFEHLQQLGHDTGHAGDLIVRLTSDIKSLNLLLTRYIQTLISFLFTFGGIVVTMYVMDRQLTFLALVVVPPLYLLSFHFTARVETLSRKKREKESEVASLVQETVTSKDVIQAFAREDQEKKHFAREAGESLKATLESMKVSKGYSRAVQLITAIGTALVIYVGARRALGGHVTPGDLIVFIAYLRDLYKPVEGLSELILDFTGALISGERVAEILETKVQVRDAPDATPAPPFRGEVLFEKVTFGYEPGRPILQDLSFVTKPGETVALIGSSGTGKSTVVNLFIRFFDPWAGRILIDGQDIRRYTVRSLREQISVVLQEPLLLRRTVRENIAYGKPEASLEEIREAARAAQAHDFILRLPDGYDTFLREQGANLSGGQRQRIALARAILKNAPIFVFDEPVTGLDAETEARFNQTLNRLMQGKTNFIIAHRFSTIVKSHLILLIEEGRVAEQGTHEELLGKSERYRQLYELQRF
ncbi:MAG: ABC transporter ATP-binding protein [Deltaproteobacteria bacterium]|nr:ABC transporter ATP-binding protein [Deltaproteobacteria bacterium]